MADFHTTKKGGSGFGLAQTRRALVDHGGDIEIESSRECGTELVLRFPADTPVESTASRTLTAGRSKAPHADMPCGVSGLLQIS